MYNFVFYAFYHTFGKRQEVFVKLLKLNQMDQLVAV